MKLATSRRLEQVAWAVTMVQYLFFVMLFFKVNAGVHNSFGNVMIGFAWGCILTSMKYFQSGVKRILEKINTFLYRRSKDYFVDSL
jgi:hypothetical protein